MKFGEYMKQQLKEIKITNILMMTLAGIIYGFAVAVFLNPVNMYDCGMSGTSQLFGQITPDFLTLSKFLIVFNIPLFIYGFKKQGLVFTIYGIYAVIIYSVTVKIITDVLPVNVSTSSPFAGKDLLLCAIFGGVISGLGSGIALRFGGAIDGLEVLAIIFSKKFSLSVGTFCFIYNVLLYTVCGIVTKSWIIPLYSIVTYFCALKTLDFIIDGIDRAKSAIIITEHPDKVCKALTKEFESGITKISAKGGYSDKDKTVVYFVVNRFQIVKMKNIVHKVDPKAFISIIEVADVFSANNEE